MGETKLKCEVIMIDAPDNYDRSQFTIHHHDKYSDQLLFSYTRGGADDLIALGYKPKYLYLVSSREIIAPCMTIEMLVTGEKSVWQVDNENDIDLDNQQIIEATSNYYMSEHAKVPLIPDSFLEKYVEAQGNIKEVMIEMWDAGDSEYTGEGGAGGWTSNWVPITRKDNTVIISSIKDSWSKEELEREMCLFATFCSLDKRFHQTKTGEDLLKEYWGKNEKSAALNFLNSK